MLCNQWLRFHFLFDLRNDYFFINISSSIIITTLFLFVLFLFSPPFSSTSSYYYYFFAFFIFLYLITLIFIRLVILWLYLDWNFYQTCKKIWNRTDCQRLKKSKLQAVKQNPFLTRQNRVKFNQTKEREARVLCTHPR